MNDDSSDISPFEMDIKSISQQYRKYANQPLFGNLKQSNIQKDIKYQLKCNSTSILPLFDTEIKNT